MTDIYMNKYRDYFPYLRILKLHVDTKVDEQTMLFFYIQAFLLPEDEVTEVFILFLVSHPYQQNLYRTLSYISFFLFWFTPLQENLECPIICLSTKNKLF